MLSKRLLSRYCQSESLSEEGLRELFERHGVTPNNNEVPGCEKVFFKLCFDGKITEGIIRCFLQYFPAAANFISQNGLTPLHAACFNNERISLNIVQQLVDAAPNSVRSVGKKGGVIFHYLCSSIKVGEASAEQILKFLIEKYPEGVRHVDNKGSLPIHSACQLRSPEFCRNLIEAYPGSEQIPDPENNLPPFIVASVKNKKATVEMFYKLNPVVFNMNHAITTESGEVYDVHPLYLIIMSMHLRRDPEALVETAQFLLDSSPNMIAEMSGGVAMLNLACTETQNMVTNQSNVNSNLEIVIQMIKLIFDAHPEAIEYDRIASNIHNWNQEIQAFINSQLVYARQAGDSLQMTTPDDNGQLPLHTALQNNVRLGSIKLLVKGNPTALHSPDNSGSLPLHVACQHHNSTAVIQYLVGLDKSALEAVDNEHNTALHYACRSAKYETITMLLDEYDAVSISKQNADGKLPLDLLLESNVVSDRGSIEYTETIFRLLRAYPETVMNYNVHVNEEEGASASYESSTRNNKRRRLDVD